MSGDTLSPIYEGDVILFSALEAEGFVSSLPISSSFSHVTILPHKEDAYSRPVISNVHFLAFQIMPEYADGSYDPLSLPSEAKEEHYGFLHRKIVYGRKIKLLHLASNSYLSLPSVTGSIIESKAGVLKKDFDDSCLFKILPSGKARGETIYHGDKFILESVLQKSYQVVCLRNSLTDSYELKLGENHSVFQIHLQTSTNVKVSSKTIRGGCAVMLCNTQIDAYIGGQGSTLTEELSSHEGIVSKVGARKKRNILIPRPPPVSGDCWWQLEKWDNPLNGEPIIYGERYRLKHLLTSKYLAVTDDMKLILTDSSRQDCTFDFVIRGSGNSNDDNNYVKKEDIISLEFTCNDDVHCLSLEENEWEWMTDSAKNRTFGSKWFNLCLTYPSDQQSLNGFKIIIVKPDILYLLYSIEGIKCILAKYMQIINDHEKDISSTEPFLGELQETLNNLSEYMFSCSQSTQKICIKMLRTTHVIDLLMGYLTLPNLDRKISEAVCRVLKAFASVPSHRCHEYLAKDSFIQTFLDKLGTGIGVEAVLSKLVEDESAIAKTLVEKFMKEETMRSISSRLDAATLELLSTLCFVSGRPEKSLQISICENVIGKDRHNFFWTEAEKEQVYYFKGDKSETKKPLSDFGGADCEFFIAQLNLFSSVCKGINDKCIELVQEWVPFTEALTVLTKLTVHPSIKSAYLKLVMSVYLDKSIEDSGVDIDNIWHCYLWEKLSPTSPPLKASNITKNLVKDLKHGDEITELIDNIIKDVRERKKLCVRDSTDENGYLYQMLDSIELLIDYGYRWNIDQESYFDLDALVLLLDGKTDSFTEEESNPELNKEYNVTGRYKRKDNSVIFQIKFKVVKILHIFFKQLIHLALERFIIDFSRRKTNSILSPEDLINPPKNLLEDDITEHIKTHSNHVVSSAQSKLQKFFSFEYYRCFDIQGNRLVNILRDLMLYENDELRAASAALLFDIYNKEHIMLEQARKCYIVEGDRGIYDQMMRAGSFQKGTRHLKVLLLGMADDDVAEELGDTAEAMKIDEDETEPATRTQNIAFTTGVFSAVLNYVLKFCESIEEDQVDVFSNACKSLRMMCRENPKIQETIFVHIEDLIRSSIHATSSVARLITEVLTNNTSLCQKLSQDIIRQIYTLATTNADYPEYLEYFTTLEAIIKPCKSNAYHSYVKLNQQTISRLFHDTYQDVFKEFLSKDFEDQRTDILETSSDDGIHLLKLLYIASFLATCCEGHYKFAEDMSQDIFSLTELAGILTNSNISDERKVPFARLILEAYLTTEKDSIVSLHQLSINSVFWDHVNACSQRLASLPETLQDDDERKQIKYYLRKIFRYHVGWNDIIDVGEDLENCKNICYTLFYLTKGIGPLLTSFCNETAACRKKKLTWKEYDKIIRPRIVCLKAFGASLISLLNKENEEMFLSSEDQSGFWKGCLNSIDNALPSTDESSRYHVFTSGLTENYFMSEELTDYRIEIKSEQETNELYQHFINNYKIVYEWDTANHVESKGFCAELLPGGSSFLKLVELFDDFQVYVQEIYEEKYYSAAGTNVKCLLTMLRVLFVHMQHQMTCKQKILLAGTLTMTFKILIGIIHVRTQKTGCNMKEVESIQNALIKMKFPENAMLHIPHPDDDITMHVMSFLAALVINSNEDAQDKLCHLVSDEDDFFTQAHKLLEKLSLQFGYTLKYVFKREVISEIKRVKKQKPLEREESFRSNVQVDEDGENIQLLEKSPPLTAVASFDEVDAAGDREFHDRAQVNDNIAYVEEPVDNVISKRVGIVLELVSAMCDGQHKKMQHILRIQENLVTSYNIVGEIAVLLQTLAEAPMVSNVPIIIKAIQGLIEMCAGNYENQQVALDGQVIDSINIILKEKKPKSTDRIRMQCKAIELLEVLLEETDEKHSSLLKAISKDLQTDHIIDYIKNMYDHYTRKINDENYDDIIEENMYRAYHVLRGMADNAEVDIADYVGISMDSEPWKFLMANTHSIEINYITKENKELLTRVYFPFESSGTLNDDEKYKLQSDINRDGTEDKVKDLLNWTDSVLKKYNHKKLLNKHKLRKAVFLGSTVRHWMLIFLTILLNVFLIAFFKIPQFSDCMPNLNMTSKDITTPLILPRPSACWSVYQYLLIYVFGVPHLILSVWMVLEYFLEEAPNFKFGIPFIQQFLFDLVQKNKSWLNERFCNLFEAPEESQCYDIYFFSVYPMYRILFMVFSILGLATYGYFYCFCLFYIFIKVDVAQFVIKAIVGKAKQLFFVALLILCLLMVYAVLSFAFMSSFFDLSESLYCRTLWECLVTVVREGLLDSFGGKIPVTYGNSITNFNIYLWRSFFDLTYYILITTIALNVVTAIFVDRFSELRAERDEALKDQKEVCFICGIANDKFETEGIKGRGFTEHYKYDHNMYSYIYYAAYIKSKPSQEHNAIEKYVNEMMDKSDIKFFPLRKAKVLGGTVATRDTKLILELKKTIEQISAST